MSTHSTPLKATQFATVVTVFLKALAKAVDYYGVKKAIKLTENKGEEVTEMVKKILESLDTGRDLSLRRSISSAPTWKNYRISELVDGNKILDLLHEEGYVGEERFPGEKDDANFITVIWDADMLKMALSDFTFTKVKDQTLLDLIVVEVGDLGNYFRRGVKRFSLKEIYERALKQGVYLCPDSLGPKLRLEYPNQPNEEKLFIASKPIRGNIYSPDEKEEYIFYMEHSSRRMKLGITPINLSLDSKKPPNDKIFSSSSKFIFCRYNWQKAV